MAGKRHLSGRSLRLLFALGILKGKGSGKKSTSGRRDMGAALEAARKNSATRQAQRASFGRAVRKTRREKGGEAARKMLASYRNPDAVKWRYLFRK